MIETEGEMKKRNIVSTLIILVLCAVGATVTSAQFPTQGQGRYVNTYSRSQVDNFVRQLETSSNLFRDDFRREINNSGLNNSTRRTFITYVDQFENAVDRLRIRFNSNDSWWESRNEVRAMITNSQNLNTAMNNAAFQRRLERQWNRLRDNVNKLADTYDLPGLNGGGWNGGNGSWNNGNNPRVWRGTGRGGNVPSWAIGTFYSRNPQTGGQIEMIVERNGQVSLYYDNSEPIYATMTGTTLNNPPYRSRVTQITNGIRTTGRNGDTIDYYRNRDFDRSDRLDRRGWERVTGMEGPLSGGNVPSWAVGTFYAQNPLNGGTIQMTVNPDGNVTLIYDNSQPIYATMNGTTLSNPPYQSRVSRITNGIRTTGRNGDYIDYFRR
jgi:hypothetical protein